MTGVRVTEVNQPEPSAAIIKHSCVYPTVTLSDNLMRWRWGLIIYPMYSGGRTFIYTVNMWCETNACGGVLRASESSS